MQWDGLGSTAIHFTSRYTYKALDHSRVLRQGKRNEETGRKRREGEYAMIDRKVGVGILG